MPKIKTKKSIAKRVKVTGSGKYMRMKAFNGCKHIRISKSAKRVRGFRQPVVTDRTDAKRISRAMPYA